MICYRYDSEVADHVPVLGQRTPCLSSVSVLCPHAVCLVSMLSRLCQHPPPSSGADLFSSRPRAAPTHLCPRRRGARRPRAAHPALLPQLRGLLRAPGRLGGDSAALPSCAPQPSATRDPTLLHCASIRMLQASHAQPATLISSNPYLVPPYACDVAFRFLNSQSWPNTKKNRPTFQSRR